MKIHFVAFDNLLEKLFVVILTDKMYFLVVVFFLSVYCSLHAELGVDLPYGVRATEAPNETIATTSN